MMKSQRRQHALLLASVLHRLSGLLLAVFLPVHFWVLSLALNDRAALDGFLSWTDFWYVKCAEYGLVFLLSVHLFGGLRLMALEWMPWSARQKTYAASAVAVGFAVSTGFFLTATLYG
jgi:fumarate reductase subunit D